MLYALSRAVLSKANTVNGYLLRMRVLRWKKCVEPLEISEVIDLFGMSTSLRSAAVTSRGSENSLSGSSKP